MRPRVRLFAAFALLLVGGACARGPASDHRALDERGEPLRSDFAADSGKVRAIVLASPT